VVSRFKHDVTHVHSRAPTPTRSDFREAPERAERDSSEARAGPLAPPERPPRSCLLNPSPHRT
jgi:hypothetical protein